MDPDDSSFVEALQKETAILQKRVDACKSHILMLTCFDWHPHRVRTSDVWIRSPAFPSLFLLPPLLPPNSLSPPHWCCYIWTDHPPSWRLDATSPITPLLTFLERPPLTFGDQIFRCARSRTFLDRWRRVDKIWVQISFFLYFFFLIVIITQHIQGCGLIAPSYLHRRISPLHVLVNTSTSIEVMQRYCRWRLKKWNVRMIQPAHTLTCLSSVSGVRTVTYLLFTWFFYAQDIGNVRPYQVYLDAT